MATRLVPSHETPGGPFFEEALPGPLVDPVELGVEVVSLAEHDGVACPVINPQQGDGFRGFLVPRRSCLEGHNPVRLGLGIHAILPVSGSLITDVTAPSVIPPDGSLIPVTSCPELG